MLFRSDYVGSSRTITLETATSGIITTGSNKITIANTAANSISGGSTSSYINGNLRRHMATNTDTYAFPIGNGTNATNYQRVDLINGNLTGVTYIDATTTDMESGNMFDLNTSQTGTQLVEVYDKQWTLTPDAQPSGGTYGVNLYLNGVGGTYLSDNTFTIVKTQTGCDVVIGYSTTNTNRVNIPVDCETCDVNTPITFNANLFKEVLVANRECSAAILEVSNEGLAKVNFKIDDYDSTYYVVAIQDVD